MGFFQDAAGEAKKLPWWAWGAGAVVLLLVYEHFKNSASGATATDAAASSDGSASGSGDATGDIGTPGPTGTEGSPTGTTTTTTSGTGSGATTTQSTKTYTVKSGDTLNAIASRNHVDEPALYSMNSGTIEATARSHGFSSSDGGHWIFPGEVLKIPA